MENKNKNPTGFKVNATEPVMEETHLIDINIVGNPSKVTINSKGELIIDNHENNKLD